MFINDKKLLFLLSQGGSSVRYKNIAFIYFKWRIGNLFEASADLQSASPGMVMTHLGI